MCFSATASFSVAGGLSIIGLLSLRSVTVKGYYFFAVIPFLFAVQQAAEGIVWLTIHNDAYQSINFVAMMVFLIFATTVWPVWIPMALLYLETDLVRQKILWILDWWGRAVAIYSIYLLVMFSARVDIFDGHLLYQIDQTLRPDLYLFCYYISTVIPFFVSSFALTWLFGLIVTGMLLLTYMAWYVMLISVWCFFAAVLSVLVLVSLRLQQ